MARRAGDPSCFDAAVTRARQSEDLEKEDAIAFVWCARVSEAEKYRDRERGTYVEKRNYRR